MITHCISSGVLDASHLRVFLNQSQICLPDKLTISFDSSTLTNDKLDEFLKFLKYIMLYYGHVSTFWSSHSYLQFTQFIVRDAIISCDYFLLASTIFSTFLLYLNHLRMTQLNRFKLLVIDCFSISSIYLYYDIFVIIFEFD